MRKKNKTTKIVISVSDESQADVVVESQKEEKKKPDVEQRIYNALNTAERIAVKAAQIHQILKKSAKKKKKKNKKLGKVDKKTGTLILKKEKKQKAQKAMKRYKPPKKK
ncbi:MAG: hypothetical protein E7611_04515 [Ruminococcaceae bacterium]|nr:hypothetical protein [Oscillospiraceae bacterium]